MVAAAAVAWGVYIQVLADVPSVPYHVIHGVVSGMCLLPAAVRKAVLPIQEGSCRYDVFASILKTMSPGAALVAAPTVNERVASMRESTDGIADILAKQRWCTISTAYGVDDSGSREGKHVYYGVLKRSFWALPPGVDNSTNAKTIIYFHGGGYMSGNAQVYTNPACELARRTGARVIVAQYPLAPETPMPGPVHHMVKFYRSLLKTGVAPKSTILAGDSAGGGMALLVMQALLTSDDAGLLPAGAILLSPWVTLDRDEVGPSVVDNDKRCPFANKAVLDLCARAAVNIYDTEDPDGSVFRNAVHSPEISPIHGRLDGLPPLLISAGEADVLVSSQRTFRDLAVRAGVDVIYSEVDGMGHVFQIFTTFFPEAEMAMDGPMRDFVAARLGVKPH